MRAILILIGLAALVVVGLMSFGLLKLNATPGSLPSLKVEGGSAPKVDADMAKIVVGTENKTITVPTVKMDRPEGNSTAQ
ncbi:hypothetical protein ASG11_01140 [Sphingomonas sp. Leaf357]|uniref:hypothetical protein n=1 Tax=Sphingomonadaceae TaxID=41297 RepID=UPI0006FB7A5B|nr:hypothetical protein [Sphingomonas sp. Leaf357]KQS03038.1 hypothetical protein ASG11_01140 [Sphingomonas sp. Leaf357]